MSLRSVSQFVERVKQKHLKVKVWLSHTLSLSLSFISHPHSLVFFQVLVCNAGVFAASFGVTEDGFETHFGVNHVGHFALVTQMMPLLVANAPARIVCVTSETHFAGALTASHVSSLLCDCIASVSVTSFGDESISLFYAVE